MRAGRVSAPFHLPRWFAAGALALLTLGSDPADAMTRERTAIERAIQQGDVLEVERLARSGEDLEAPLFNRGTAAIRAAAGDQWNIVLILLAHGANPAAEDRLGMSISSVARTSRLIPGTPDHDDLERVRAILRERGLY